MSFNCLKILIQCQILKITLSISEKYETVPTNPSIDIYINRINSRLVLKRNNAYNLELQTPEIIKLLGSTKD